MMQVKLVEVGESTASFILPLPAGTLGRRGNINATVALDHEGATTLTVKLTARATLPTWQFAKILEDFLNWIAEEAEQVFFLMERIDTDTRYTGRTLPLLRAEATLSVSNRERVLRAIIEKARREAE